jgi:hypothetical protein
MIPTAAIAEIQAARAQLAASVSATSAASCSTPPLDVQSSMLDVRCSQPPGNSPSAPPRLCGELKGYFVLAWSEQYHVLPTKFPDGTPIPVAYVKWDPAAKQKDGSWDLDRVMRTAHFECPHCKGKIYNHEKEWMDARGYWMATKKGEPGVAGFQLSSLYVTHDETALGILAKKFLGARASGQTMKGFINNDLAEVDVMQEHGRNKIELTSHTIAQTDWVAQLTADFHKNYPYIWFTVRKWCAFKLLPPFPITNGLPDFVPLLLEPGNEGPREKCLKLLGLTAAQLSTPTPLNTPSPVWPIIAELMRFDSRTGSSPLIEFLLAQNIVGEKLIKLYRETAAGNTMDFRKIIYREMSSIANRQSPIANPPRGGDSELVAAGYCELSGAHVWEELKDIIAHYHIGQGMSIPNRCVAIDCGFAEKFNRTVLQMCYESATVYKHYDPVNSPKDTPLFYAQPRHQYCLPAPYDGWLAVRGKPTNRPLGGGKLHPELHMNIEDPFYGTPRAGSAVTEVLELPQGLFWLRKEDLRQKRTKQTYAVSPQVEFYPQIRNPDGSLQIVADRKVSNFKMADYEKQLNEQYYDELKGKVEPKHGRGGSQNRAHPYHLDDCETYQIALATHNEFFEHPETQSR